MVGCPVSVDVVCQLLPLLVGVPFRGDNRLVRILVAPLNAFSLNVEDAKLERIVTAVRLVLAAVIDTTSRAGEVPEQSNCVVGKDQYEKHNETL